MDYFLKTKRWKKIGCGLTKVICPVLCFEMLIRSFRCVGFKNASFLLQNQTRKRRVCLGLTVGSSSGNLQVLVGIRVGFSGSFQQLHFFSSAYFSACSPWIDIFFWICCLEGVQTQQEQPVLFQTTPRCDRLVFAAWQKRRKRCWMSKSMIKLRFLLVHAVSVMLLLHALEWRAFLTWRHRLSGWPLKWRPHQRLKWCF